MYRQGRILIVEDDARWQQELTAVLQKEGYSVDTASTATRARDLLQHHLYHLLILDIRLKNIEGNQDGILVLDELVKQGLTEAIGVVMLSSFEEFMRTSFKLYHVLDFFKKGEFDDKEFTQEIQQIFADKIKINLGLEISWEKDPEEIVMGLQPGRQSLVKESAFYYLMLNELDDLLKRLFFRAKNLLVRPAARGWSGAGVLRARPFYSTGGGGYEVIVKFGDCPQIKEEYHNFVEYVQPFLGGERSTSIIAMRQTTHLAGITYSLLGAAHGQVVDFGEFYRRNTLIRIKRALDGIFWHTCRAWYANRGNLSLLNLTADYQHLFCLSATTYELPPNLQVVQQGDQSIVFSALADGRAFINPLSWAHERTFVRSTYICITHGDFNHRNLLVDPAGNTWLIDFQGTGEGHILRDVAALDSTIRFQLLTAEEATLQERLDMEEALLEIDRFSQIEQLQKRFSSPNAALTKAYMAAAYLRAIAYKLIATNPDDDITEYYIALLYNALHTLRFSNLSPVQHEHALLCASLLARKLTQ